MDEIVEERAQDKSSSASTWLWGAAGAAVLAGAGYFFLSGGGEARWDSGTRDTVAAPVASKVADSKEPPMLQANKAREVRGVVQAAEEATLASRITAHITSMPFRVGAQFRQGAVLVQLDCSQMRAELAAANAATAAYQKTYETNVELDRYEAVGINEVAVSKANLNKARAEGTAISAQLRDCQVVAPFSGTVVEEIAHRGEIAASGQPLLKLQSGGALEAELIVPSHWLKWVRPGVEFAFVIDETGEQATGIVKRLGASVDPVSKTIRVTGDLLPGEGVVLPGMSGTALFADPQAVAAKVSSRETGGDGVKKPE